MTSYQTLDEFFRGRGTSRAIFDALHAAVSALGPVEMRVTKSQVAFRRARAFAWAWMPGMYLRGRGAPLVLTVALRQRDDSPRWKQVVEPAPGRFVHHLELYSETGIDDEVRRWLQQAWAQADEDKSGSIMAEANKLGQIIILNGAPRSGKSSIAAVIQDTYDGLWMNLGVDRFMQMTPARYLPGIGLRPGGERPDLEPYVVLLYRAMYDSIAAHSHLGLNVVADVDHHDAYAVPRGILPDCALRLSGLPVLFVGVRCPIETIMERRRATGWNTGNAVDAPVPHPVHLWQQEVHIPGIYDLEVDTTVLSPEGCAAVIRERLDRGPTPAAFQSLAAMAAKHG